jgi:hypothetical protein
MSRKCFAVAAQSTAADDLFFSITALRKRFVPSDDEASPYRPRGALARRTRSQIGTTMTAPNRK